MRRFLPALPVLLLVAVPAAALIGASQPPLPMAVRAAVADAACVGTVTAVEPGPAQALPYPGATAKVAYSVAVVQVDDAITGLKGMTHVRVGFAPAAADRVVGRVPGVRGLKAGDRAGLFLVKHPTADFYVMPERCPRLPPDAVDFKTQIEQAKAAVKVAADPAAALTAPAAADRAFAARVLIVKYRTGSLTGGEVEPTAIPAAESRLLLDALGEMDWAKLEPILPQPAALFRHLGATAADGWTPPVVPPGADFHTTMKAAFDAWRAGPGATFQVKKYVPKKQAAK